jgi:hypothetical protein
MAKQPASTVRITKTRNGASIRATGRDVQGAQPAEPHRHRGGTEDGARRADGRRLVVSFEFVRNGVLYQVQTHVGEGKAVVDVREKDAREQQAGGREEVRS